jgi:hypothetical protein
MAADAARPFVTDDARIVDKGGCQIETFQKRQARFSESEFWFLPACSSPLGAELTIGGLRLNSTVVDSNRSVVMQAKTLLKPLETNGSGYALTLGMLRVSPAGARSVNSPYFNAIGSFSFADDKVVVHTNLGGIRDRAANIGRGTWGIGAEVQLSPPRWFGILEAYGQRGEKPTLHTGLRIWIVPNRVQMDTTIGFQQSSPERRFHTIGLRLLWD